MSFKKILCPTDFSPGARQAMRSAARLASESGAELVLLHAWHIPPMSFAGEYTFAPDVARGIIDDAERGLEAARREAEALGARRVSVKLAGGLPWHEIIEVAESDPAIDLAVLGTHGRTGLARVMLGSVAEKVVRHAPCSILVIRPDSEPRAYDHVLCPTDFSESSRHALDLATALAKPGGKGIELVHVLEIPVAYSGASYPSELFAELDRLSTTLLEKWAAHASTRSAVPVATRTRPGWPGAETLALLDEDRSFDLVVMGSHGRTGLRRVLLGSVAEKLVRHARCPVLVARQRA